MFVTFTTLTAHILSVPVDTSVVLSILVVLTEGNYNFVVRLLM